MCSWEELDAKIQAIYDAAIPRERIKLNQARAIWSKRDKVWPHGRHGGKPITYRDAWEIRWRDNYDDFVNKQKELRAYELRRSVQGNAEAPGNPVSGGDPAP